MFFSDTSRNLRFSMWHLSHSVLRFPTIIGASLFVSALFSVLVDACGAPILLKELSAARGGEQLQFPPGPPPISAPFNFRIYDSLIPGSFYATWPEEYSPSDVGRVFVASPEIVAGANAALGSTTSIYDLQTGGVFFNDGEWGSSFPPGFQITSIERIIEQLTLTPIDQSRYIVDAAQRIRIWGEPIPEPETFGLSLLAIALYAVMALRGVGSVPRSRIANGALNVNSPISCARNFSFRFPIAPPPGS
jgi:hypothetical protein